MDLKNILEKHSRWLANENDGDQADLSGADLRMANLDFSCWSLSCKTLNIGKVDAKICAQLLYHTLRVIQKCEDKDMKKLLKLKSLLKEANMFHRVGECGKVGK